MAMDQSRFDDLARRLGAGATRRAGLKAALGGLLGLATGPAALPPTDGEAKKHHRKKRTRMECSAAKPCPAGMNCLDLGNGKGQCICANSGQPPCGTTCCGAGQTCSPASGAPRCTCSSGRAACGGRCCGSEELCIDGACSREPMCPSGQDRIDGACVCRTSPCNGRCCPQNHACRNGTCVTARAYCDGIPIRDGADLSYCVFENEDFAQDTLRNVNFEGAAFRGCIMQGFRCIDCRLDKAEVGGGTVWSQGVLSGGTARATSFPGIDLVGARIERVDATGARFVGTDLAAATVTDSTLDGADFTRASLRNTLVRGAASFSRTSLRQATFAVESLQAVEFDRADLTGARIGAAYGAQFTDCVLADADFSGVVMGGNERYVNRFVRCDMRRARLSGATCTYDSGRPTLQFVDVDLRNATFGDPFHRNAAAWARVNLAGASTWRAPADGYRNWCANVLPDGTRAPDGSWWKPNQSTYIAISCPEAGYTAAGGSAA